jgi:hypothetical protein
MPCNIKLTIYVKAFFITVTNSKLLGFPERWVSLKCTAVMQPYTFTFRYETRSCKWPVFKPEKFNAIHNSSVLQPQ